MVDTADRVGVHLMVCQSLRFDHPYAAMRQAVAAGEIGEVMHLYSRRNTIQVAAARVLGEFSLAYWLTPHDIDMMLWTVGRPITSVKAYSRERAKGRQDFIIAVFTFDNGVVGVLETSWSTPAFSGRPQSEHFSIHGTRGAADVLGHENAVAIYHVDGQPGLSRTLAIRLCCTGGKRGCSVHCSALSSASYRESGRRSSPAEMAWPRSRWPPRSNALWKAATKSKWFEGFLYWRWQ